MLRAEWTKFRTVRGWVIGMIIAALVTVRHRRCSITASAAARSPPGGPVIVGHGCAAPIGPGGEAVTDSFYFVHRPLAGDGSITARVTSLPR